jgi:transcriptional regulator with XRE-family HTH domain
MSKAIHKQTLRDLRRERGLVQGDLGGICAVSMTENGHQLPGPRLLATWAKILGLPPIQVMAACRESQRQALMVARAGRGRTRRTGRGDGVVGKGRAAGSCPQPAKGGAA